MKGVQILALLVVLIFAACGKKGTEETKIDEEKLLKNFGSFVSIPQMSGVVFAKEIDLQKDGFKEIYAVIKTFQAPQKNYLALFNAKTYAYMGALELPPYQSVDEVLELEVTRVTGDKIDDMSLIFKEKKDTINIVWNTTSTFAQGKMRFLFDYEVFNDSPTAKNIMDYTINEKSEWIGYNEKLNKKDSNVYVTYDVKDYVETGWIRPKTHFFLTKGFAYPRVKDRNAVWNSNYQLMAQIYGGMGKGEAMLFYQKAENLIKINKLKEKYNF